MEEVGMAKKNTRKKKNKQNFGLLEDDDEEVQKDNDQIDE